MGEDKSTGFQPEFNRAIQVEYTDDRITSWPDVLAGDEVLAGAILDRVLHSATVLNIQGRSYRLRDLETNIGSVTSGRVV